jgi:ribosomal subunit interface protein
MRVIIKAQNIKLTPAIKTFIEDKIKPLEKFIKIFYNDYYLSPSSGKVKEAIEAWVEIGKVTLHHRKGPFFRAECQIRFAGKSVRSETASKDLGTAVTEVKDELQRKLKKEKGRKIAQKERKKRTLKRKIKIVSESRLSRKGRIREEGI